MPTMRFEAVTDLKTDYDKALMETYPDSSQTGLPGAKKMSVIFWGERVKTD